MGTAAGGERVVGGEGVSRITRGGWARGILRKLGVGPKVGFTPIPRGLVEPVTLGLMPGTWAAVSGFEPWEGPYREQGLPKCRWMVGPVSKLQVTVTRPGLHHLRMVCTAYHPLAALRVVHRGKKIVETGLATHETKPEGVVVSCHLDLREELEEIEIHHWPWEITESGREFSVLMFDLQILDAHGERVERLGRGGERGGGRGAGGGGGMLSELLPYHRYIRQNAVRDIRHRYAGTGLGLFWHVISPLMQILIYYYVFTHRFHQDYPLPGVRPEFGFAVYLCSGMLTWVSFSEGVIRGTGSFHENATYLKKLPIPGPVFVAKTAGAATIQLAINVSILIVFSLVVGLRPTWTWLLLPVVCGLWQAMGFGLGLMLGTLNVFFRDIQQVTIVVMQIWMWSIPVVYPDGDVQNLMLLNPPYAYLMGVRGVFLHGVVPGWGVWATMVAWVVVMVTGGMLVYRGLKGEIRDVL